MNKNDRDTVPAGVSYAFSPISITSCGSCFCRLACLLSTEVASLARFLSIYGRVYQNSVL